MLENMPSAAARRMYEDQIPPFMTVFDLDPETMADQETVTLVDPKLVEIEQKSSALANPPHQPGTQQGMLNSDPSHRHHDSTSTQMSESTDSSPTTTLSTTDSSPLSDPSPSSSPDSPVNLIPLRDYPSSIFGGQPNGHGGMLGIPETNTLARPMTSPSPRRPRNMKGLSILPPLSITTTTASFVATEPSSPSFIKPKIPAMKRKPSQLSLKTNTSDLIKKTSMEVPASPAMPPSLVQRRDLKHSTSSPHMFASALKSSTFGPSGGMGFPTVFERNESGLSEVLRPMKPKMMCDCDELIAEEDSPIRTQMANLSEYEPYHESVNNEDQKSPGYPDGPIAIYGDEVYLYLEPTADEASRFDVVINVACEVANPFDTVRPTSSATTDADSPIPDTAVSTASYTTAFEYRLEEDSSVETPTTPKACPPQSPEYIHIHWDHNTDIAPDLMSLCETIESRTKSGKKVLVHCQQGASRSASLIIAYGLYQNPELSVNDAYYAAQAKSRWISPNMKLMYSLQDFQKELSKRRKPASSTYRPRTGRSPTKHRLTLSADAIDMAPLEPHSAPISANNVPGKENNSGIPNRSRGNSTPGSREIGSAPASAPLSYSWKEQREEKKADSMHPAPTLWLESLPKRPKSSLGRPEPRFASSSHLQVQPLSTEVANAPTGFALLPPPSPGFPRLEDMRDAIPGERTVTLSSLVPDDSALMSPRVETMTTNPLHSFSGVGDMRFVESPPTPTEGLFSPRESTFSEEKFSFLEQIAGMGRPVQVSDPRSPPTKGEAPIIRSIDTFL